jgi:hypothetical protein
MLKYAKSNSAYKVNYIDQYLNAKQVLKEKNIHNYFSMDISALGRILKERQTYVKETESLNKQIINAYGEKIEDLILSTLPFNMSEIDKITYLIEYILSNVTFSEDYFECCMKTSIDDDFDFDFKNGIPADKSKNGMLVIGQGTNIDIVNLLCYLGDKLGLNIKVSSEKHNNKVHIFNTITFQDGTTNYIDVAKAIRDKNKYGDIKYESLNRCFLVLDGISNNGNNYYNKTERFTEKELSNIKLISKDDILNSYSNIEPYANRLNKLISCIKNDIYNNNVTYSGEESKIR